MSLKQFSVAEASATEDVDGAASAAPFAMLIACIAVGFALMFSSEYAKLARHAYKSFLFA